ncbi:spermatogenesis-associated protein 13 [Schistocerca cancellata]|uniref:spermatogenesis-associated protein 13 n=2 Tax=Schistocerca TaxID=7008 RepID=UPI00211764FC|nr:spermatogenesis-associated protein 13 [Schistocerca cancellata]
MQRPSGVFPWRRATAGGASPCSSPSQSRAHSPAPPPSPSPAHAAPAAASALRPATPDAARTAPATPIKEANNSTEGQYRRSPGLSKSVRHTKNGTIGHVDEPPTSRSDWDIHRTWPEAEADKEATSGSSNYLSSQTSTNRLTDNKELSQSQRSISSSTSESVLQKFRKSFAFKFHKKSGSKDGLELGSSKDGEGDVEEENCADDELATSQSHEQLPQEPTKEETGSDPKFKFGPLVWRSSKERKKGKKAARNAKCNSGDSGIQIEMLPGSAHVTGGDSSESHDTDHLVDDEPLDEMDSPPAVRRRVTSSEKSSRPQSEVIQQLLIDKFKADLQTRAAQQGRHQHVRRAHSDLGGQRLFQWDVRSSYRRMFSTPSPIKMRPPRASPPHPRPANLEQPVQLRNSKRRSARPQLRRSLSQPLGLNELSPLLRRKPRTSTSNVLSEDEHDARAGTSDDEMMSDSESSVASLSDRKKSFEQAMDEDLVILAEAVWDHVTMEPEELAFRAGDVIEVLDSVNRDWWWGTRGEDSGWFPAAFVRLRVSQEDTVEDCLAAMAAGSAATSQLRRRTSVSLLSNDQVRSSVVRELINTERDFVKILTDVAEGYLAECKRRTDMFSPEQINTIFGNLEELLQFQSNFLEDLEQCVDWDAPHRSCIGECFLTHRSGFRIYSEYCNSQPMATATLQELYQHNSYSKFFEACRLMRGLIEIPLDGYLLTPVQRICKYPLQLAELLKYTKVDHPDYEKIKEALEAMRNVAVLINERKRRMESLEKLAAWQQRVEGWEGEDLIEVSSQLIHHGEVIRVTTGMWTNNITLFLFDHQLVYCKKDILKRNVFVYKGRILLDASEVIDVPDGKDPQLGIAVRHCVRIVCSGRERGLVFACRSAAEKTRWLQALAEERRLVDKDAREGLEFAPAARQLARMAARCQRRRPPSKPRGKSYKRDSSHPVNNLDASHHNLSSSTSHSSSNSLGRKMGTWFTFGSSKKGRATHHPS